MRRWKNCEKQDVYNKGYGMENEKKAIVPEILLTLLQQLNYEARETEVALQSEENGGKIAKLQGFLAGATEYKEMMIESGYRLDGEYFGTQKCKTPYILGGEFTKSLAELRDIISDINDLTESYIYEEFVKELRRRIEIKKDDLFYSSDKGRDLYFVKGWHKAITKIGDTIGGLRAILNEMEKEKAEMLPFGDEE